MDDLFGDLVKTKASEEVPIVLPVKPDERKSSVPVPNVFTSTAAETKDEAVGTGTLVTLSKEELERLLQQTVQAAVDATFGKFAKSLRTVLEDMSKRLEANALTQAHQFGELKAALQELDEASAGHAENSNCRFTALDHSIREIDRAVQSMRDRQELHEAQALLAKYEPQADKAGEDKKAAAAAAAAAPAAAAAAPAPAPAAAAPVPSAPAPVAAAPASAPAPLPAPQAQPAPAPVPMGMPAPAASAPMQQHYQPPQQALGHEAPQPQYAPQPGPAPYGYQVPNGPQAMMPPTGGQQQPQYAPPQQQAPMMQPPQQQAPMMPTQQQPMLQMPPPQVQQQQQHMPPQQQQPQQQQPQQAPSGYAPPPQYQQQQAPPSQYAAPQHMQGAPSPHVPAMPHMGMGPQLSGGSMQGMPPGPSMYPTSRMPSYPAPLQQPSYHQQQPGPLTSQGSGGGGPPPQAKATSRAVPLEQVVTDIERMGFDRHRVMALVASMQKAGQPVDLNVIIDKLTRG